MRRQFPKDDIVVRVARGRELHMNEHGPDLVLRDGRTAPFGSWLAISPEELAYVLLSASGLFVERFNNAVERFQDSRDETTPD